jgi:hypothetical protein
MDIGSDKMEEVLNRTFKSKDGRKKVEVETRIKTRSGRDFTNPNETIEGYTVSICGTEYEHDEDTFNRGRFRLGSCGQIFDGVNPSEFTNSEDLSEIIRIWKRWHLSDLKAGTRQQTNILRAWGDRPKGWSYTEDTEHLKNRGMLQDFDYTYGTAWLFEPVPEHIVNKLKRLMRE